MPGFLKDHLALIVSGLGALYVAIRLFVIAGGSSETYSIILQTQGTGSVLASAILELIPSLPYFFASGWLGWRVWNNRRLDRRDWLVLVVTFVLALVISPLLTVGFVVLIVGAYFLFLLIDRRDRKARKKVRQEAANIRDSENGVEQLPRVSRERPVWGISEDEWRKLGEDEHRAKLRAVAEAEKFVDRMRSEVDSILDLLDFAAPSSYAGMVLRIDTLIDEADRQKEHPELVEIADREIEILNDLRAVAVRGEKVVEDSKRGLILTSVFVVAAWMVGSAIISDPWIPLERVDTPAGSTVGYVLDESADEVTILRDKPRDVIRTGPVAERTYCVSSRAMLPRKVSTLLATTVLLPNRGASYPEC